MNLSAQDDHFKMPKEWDAGFVISLSHTGSMSGGSTHLTLTRDTGKYVVATLDKAPKEKIFTLTEADRATILKKMKELRADQIKSQSNYAAVQDGWSQSLCFGLHCVEGGTSVKMSDDDAAIFQAAYGYLENFAMGKKSKK